MDDPQNTLERKTPTGEVYLGPEITPAADTTVLGEIAALRVQTAMSELAMRAPTPVAASVAKRRRIGAWVSRLRALIRDQGGLVIATKVCFDLIKQNGLRQAFHDILNEMRPNSQMPTASTGGSIDTVEVLTGPLFSIIVPIYNTPAVYLEECINSVRHQTYGNWQLILVDDASSESDVRGIMVRHQLEDRRIQCIFRKTNGHISETVNTGLEHAGGSYFTVLDHDDTLAPEALQWIAKAARDNPKADYIYTDEDKLSADGQRCFGPFFKPDWSPEYMLAMMYTCHMSVFKRAVLDTVGGYRSEFDGAQDYEFTLRVLSRCENVVHVPKVLYHWRAWDNSTAESIDAKPYSIERQRRALTEYLTSLCENFTLGDGPLPGHHAIVFHPRRKSKVSIVIPTANGSIEIDGRTENHLNAVVDSIKTKTTYANYEIVIVHNGDLRSDQTKALENDDHVKLVLYESEVFNLADKINLGCAAADGEYLVIMNDDIRIITKDWLERMLGMMQRDGVGVVGAKLLFPDRKLQHVGIIVMNGLPGHPYYEQPEDCHGYSLGAMIDRNYLAVTGACQMTPKALFDEIGGYSNRYPINYNDVDYCLKAYQKGYRSVSLADVKLFHYEGVSIDGGRSVSDRDIEKFLEDWGTIFSEDPYYNPNLSHTTPYGF